MESAGAEFLVLGQLLIEGISAFKSYHNFPGFDLIAINESNKKLVRIQVKSRYSTSWNGFLIKNFNSDFVVFVALNRGFKNSKKNGDTGKRPPDYFIFPTKHLETLQDPKSKWGKIQKSKLTDLEKYNENWKLIKDSLHI